VAVALALMQAGPARANGDPPSQVLPTEDVYYPRDAKPSGPVTTALDLLLRRTREADYPLRVALIATASDLGNLTQYLQQPQQYADHLGPELEARYKGALLVVTPTGYGVYNAGKDSVRVLDGLESPGSDSDGLARAAIKAGARLSRAAGHPVKEPKVSGASSGAVVPLLVFAGLLALAFVLALWKRRTAE
jgi:hypothetical protein